LLFFYFNGKDLQVNAYLFSTDVVASVEYNSSTPPPFTPQYTGSTDFVGTPFTWTYKISILQTESLCSNTLKYPVVSDWLVKQGTTAISPADMAISAEKPKIYDVVLERLTTDGSTCARVAVNEIRYKDPNGINADYVFTSAQSSQAITFDASIPNKISANIDASRCTTCNYDVPALLEVTFTIYVEPGIYSYVTKLSSTLTF